MILKIQKKIEIIELSNKNIYYGEWNNINLRMSGKCIFLSKIFMLKETGKMDIFIMKQYI